MWLLKYLHVRILPLMLVAFAVCHLLAVEVESAVTATTTSTESPTTTSTLEPDASPGCKAPDIRFTVVRPETTTEQPYAKFETTQIYLPEDFTTDDVEFVEKSTHGVSERADHLTSGVVNPYQVDIDDHHLASFNADGPAAGLDETENAETKRLNHERRNKKRRSGAGRRRRVENDNGDSSGRGSSSGRFKRHVIHHDPDASPDTDQWSGGKLAAEGDVYYVHIEDILKSRSPNAELRAKLHKLKTNKKQCAKDNCKKATVKKMKKASAMDILKLNKNSSSVATTKKYTKHKVHHRRRGDSHEDKVLRDTEQKILQNLSDKIEEENENRETEPHKRWRRDFNRAIAEDMKRSPNEYESVMTNLSVSKGLESTNSPYNTNNSLNDNFQRVKRKSGKTTGALSRPKSGGDSSSKSSTSRKDKGVYEEDGGYSPVNPDEVEEEEEEEEIEEDVDIQQQFTEVSEIRFPGEIGPLGDRRLCKIRCVKGKWVGPLCATNEEGK